MSREADFTQLARWFVNADEDEAALLWDVAFGLYRGHKGWESEGWYSVKSGQCTRLLNQMGDRYYYLYVEGDNDVVWDGAGEEGRKHR